MCDQAVDRSGLATATAPTLSARRAAGPRAHDSIDKTHDGSKNFAKVAYIEYPHTRRGDGGDCTMGDLSEAVDQRALDWAANLLPEAEVSLVLPRGGSVGSSEKPQVVLYLVSLVSRDLGPKRDAQTLRVGLRYLVTTWGMAAAVEHAILCKLAFAALEETHKVSSVPEVELDLTPPPNDFWIALGLAPRPCLFLTVALSRARVVQPVRRVEKPLVLHATQDLPSRSSRSVQDRAGGDPLATK